MEEKQKNGGYRCITLKAFDSKGGDFVENPDLNMVLVDQNRQTILAEIGRDFSLISGPDGFFKRVEIGVNNYDPTQFLHQSFTIYFFDNSQDTDHQQALPTNMPAGIMNLSEQESLKSRIDNNLVAFGEFLAQDII